MFIFNKIISYTTFLAFRFVSLYILKNLLHIFCYCSKWNIFPRDHSCRIRITITWLGLYTTKHNTYLWGTWKDVWKSIHIDYRRGCLGLENTTWKSTSNLSSIHFNSSLTRSGKQWYHKLLLCLLHQLYQLKQCGIFMCRVMEAPRLSYYLVLI